MASEPESLRNEGGHQAEVPLRDASSPLLPGMAAVALYMLVLSAVVAFGVIGHHLPPLLLVLSALFAFASLGLVRRLRWGWAFTVSACLLLACYGCYMLVHFRQMPGAIMAFLNLVFFLYLVRPEVRARLR